MTEYNDLKQIVGKLTEEEYWHEIENRGFGNSKKSYYLRLIEYLFNNPQSTASECQRSIYGKEKVIAFKQLVFRAKEKILDSLLLEGSIEKSPYYDIRAREILALRKRLIQFDILNLRSLTLIAKKYLDKIIQVATKYEYYDILVFALHKKIRLSVMNATMFEYQLLLKDLNHFEDCRTSFYKSEMFLKRLHEYINERSLLLKQQKALSNFIFELERDVVRTKSNTVLYNLYLHKAEYFDIIGDYSNTKFTWTRVISLLESNKYLITTYGLGNAYLNLGISETKLCNFDLALDSFKKSFNLLKNLELNKCHVYKFQFLLSFFKADAKAIEANIDILNMYLYSGVIIHHFAATVKYYNAVLKFIQGDHISSFLLLQDVKLLDQEKESWNIAIRVLSIMNQIELEKFEIADNLIENLRKHHERVRKTLPVTKRDEKIIQVLTALSRSSYNFRITYRKKEDTLNNLSSPENDCKWKILSPEMIIFQEWFKAKRADKKYDHFEVMEQMKKKYTSAQKSFVPLAADAESPEYR